MFPRIELIIMRKVRTTPKCKFDRLQILNPSEIIAKLLIMNLQPSSISGILAKPARPDIIMAAEAAVLLPVNENIQLV